MSETILPVPIKDSSIQRLATIAFQTGRSDAQLAAEAIDAWLDMQDWQVHGTLEALASLDAGEAVSHDDVKAWVAAWGSPSEGDMPKAKT